MPKRSAISRNPWIVGICTTLCIHLLTAFVPVEFNSAPAKERPAIQLFIEPPLEPKVVEPLPEPPEQEVEEIEIPEPPPVVKRKKRKKRKAPPKPEPVVEPAEPVEEVEPVEEPVEEIPEAEEPEPVQVNLAPYGRSLHAAIQRKQRYPRAARMMRMEGTSEVEVRLYSDGSLASEPTLKSSSGHQVLDKEALRMVRVAAPFSNLPHGFIGETALFKVPVRFELIR